MDKNQKVERVFEGLAKINVKAIAGIEEELGREITFDEYVEKYMEDVTSGYLRGYVEAYTKGKVAGEKQVKRRRFRVVPNKK